MRRLNLKPFHKFRRRQTFLCRGPVSHCQLMVNSTFLPSFVDGQQVEKWPENPLTLIIAWLRERHPNAVVADFGCGDAMLAVEAPATATVFRLKSGRRIDLKKKIKRLLRRGRYSLVA